MATMSAASTISSSKGGPEGGSESDSWASSKLSVAIVPRTTGRSIVPRLLNKRSPACRKVYRDYFFAPVRLGRAALLAL